MNKYEGIFRNLVLRKKLTGYIFLRQKIIDSYILDFYCPVLKLGIEIDGESHNYTIDYDDERSKILFSHGIKLIRYTNDEIEKKLDPVIIDLYEKLENRKKELKIGPPL